MKTFFYNERGAVALFALVAAMFSLLPAARAFTSADADAIFSSYHKTFYFTNGNKGFYRATTDGGKTWFWERAEQLEMVLDHYERTTNAASLTIFSNVFNGFVADHGRSWEQNEFNDDIMWMVIACARAHQLTGSADYRDIAKANFDMCYARAWSTNLGGGLWWKTSNLSKNACVNGPAAIAAFLLYQISGDTNYLAKAKAIYEWERNTLLDPKTGHIYDSIDYRGEINSRPFTYNQGTFIGAANFLGYTNDARLAADYTKDALCENGIMPGYNQTGDGGGFNGICVRWTARFMKERGLQKSYLRWLQANADAAWKIRRPADNLSWSRWSRPAPDGPLNSWACSSSVVVLQVVPPNQELKRGFFSNLFGKSETVKQKTNPTNSLNPSNISASCRSASLPSSRRTRWAGRGHLGFDLGNFPEPSARRGTGARQFHPLDFRRAAHDLFSEDGHRLCAGLRFPVFLLHDGAATHLGENHGD